MFTIIAAHAMEASQAHSWLPTELYLRAHMQLSGCIVTVRSSGARPELYIGHYPGVTL